MNVDTKTYKYEPIALSNESTVVAEYLPDDMWARPARTDAKYATVESKCASISLRLQMRYVKLFEATVKAPVLQAKGGTAWKRVSRILG